MLALTDQHALTCDGCGGWLPDTTAREADDGYRGVMTARCHACTAIAIAQEQHAAGSRHMHATRWTAERR